MKTLLLLQLFISLILATDPFEKNQGQGNGPHPEWQELVSQSQMDFGLRMYRLISSKTERPRPQVFISPLSMYITLSMVTLGSYGETRDQILLVLGLNGTEKDTVMHEGNKMILEAIRQQTKNGEFELGNEVFLKEPGSFLPQFQEMMGLYYNAPIRTISFEDAPAAEITINKLVSDKTDQKIQSLVTNLKSETSMVLLDYTVFQGKWQFAFDKQNTKEGTFHLSDRTSVPVVWMNRQGLYPTVKDREIKCNVLEVPYEGNVSLLIILPYGISNFDQVRQRITTKRIQKYLRSLKTSLVDIYIPKITFNYGVSPKHYMAVLGMESMFSEGADFSRFSRDQKLKVSDIYHQSFLSVEEGGTEASSAAAGLLINFNKTPTFRVNRPYIIVLIEKVTQTILGVGQVTDPTPVNS